jgi:molybdopterin synthase sulfur carrier subunit
MRMPTAPEKSAMKVTVKFFTTLREIIGKKEEQIELSRPVTVEALLKQLSKTYGNEFVDYVFDELGNVRGHLQFLVNGKSITTMHGFKTKLNDGDQVAVLPPVGGG